MSCFGRGVRRWRSRRIVCALFYVRLTGLAATLCAGASGCARPVSTMQPAKIEVGDTSWLKEAEKPSEKILKGIDAPQKSDHWQVGAQVLYSIRIEGRGEVLTRLVHLRLASLPLEGVKTVRINPTSPPADSKEVFDIHDPVEGKYDLAVPDWSYKATMSFRGTGPQTGTANAVQSGSIVVWMALYDESAKRLKAHYSLLPEANLRKGLAHYSEWATQIDSSDSTAQSLTPEQISSIYEAQAAFSSFGAVIRVSPVAEPLVKRILSRSTLLGIWLFGMPRMGFKLGRPEKETRPLPALMNDRAAWQLPLLITGDDKPMLQSRISVASPDSPLDLCAGVIAFEGTDVDDPSRRFQMHLIAARRPAKP
jgi:hypothetical protein